MYDLHNAFTLTLSEGSVTAARKADPRMLYNLLTTISQVSALRAQPSIREGRMLEREPGDRAWSRRTSICAHALLQADCVPRNAPAAEKGCGPGMVKRGCANKRAMHMRLTGQRSSRAPRKRRGTLA
jgi:hypothetical protein